MSMTLSQLFQRFSSIEKEMHECVKKTRKADQTDLPARFFSIMKSCAEILLNMEGVRFFDDDQMMRILYENFCQEPCRIEFSWYENLEKTGRIVAAVQGNPSLLQGYMEEIRELAESFVDRTRMFCVVSGVTKGLLLPSGSPGPDGFAARALLADGRRWGKKSRLMLAVSGYAAVVNALNAMLLAVAALYFAEGRSLPGFNLLPQSLEDDFVATGRFPARMARWLREAEQFADLASDGENAPRSVVAREDALEILGHTGTFLDRIEAFLDEALK
ncbi:MAG: hypothetical protein PHQ23_03015 [Candidatus Wallbacteria bacterium]|nr:hypothetical protein [Candidatus Wallbacteria bacterium]